MRALELKQAIISGQCDLRLAEVYGADLCTVRPRYAEIIDAFVAHYGDMEGVMMFSAPGRSEIGGNHTDHQHGRVVAAAISLDTVAIAAATGDNLIRFASKGFPEDVIDLRDLTPKDEETGHSPALVRGVAARLKELNYAVGGFRAYSSTDVLKGSGLSSSAAFEVLTVNILSGLYNDQLIPAILVGQIGQYAENVFFGKPCGLMDQTASSVGGFVAIDFMDPASPIVKPIALNFAAHGYSLCIVDTKGQHGDLTDAYAAIRIEMNHVAGFFGKSALRGCDLGALIENAPAVRAECGDRAFLRAYHFLTEDNRAADMADALMAADIPTFLKIVRASGLSSIAYLQNIYAIDAPHDQGVMVGLALTDAFLGDRGAFRVHGGGFAGTIQAFVPTEIAATYCAYMELTFGAGSAYRLNVREIGGARVL